MKFGVVDDLLNDVSLEKKGSSQEVTWIARSLILKNERNGYVVGDIDSLAADIKHGGLAQPLEVYPCKNGKYKLLTGERRLTALDKLIENGDWTTDIPCFVRELEEYKLNLSDASKEMYALIRTNRFNRNKTDADLLFETTELKKIVEEMRKNGEKELWFGEETESVELSGRTREIVGKALDISNGQIAKIETITKKGIQQVVEAIKAQRMNIAAGYLLSSLSAADQEEFMRMHHTGEILSSDVKSYAELLEARKKTDQIPEKDEWMPDQELMQSRNGKKQKEISDNEDHGHSCRSEKTEFTFLEQEEHKKAEAHVKQTEVETVSKTEDENWPYILSDFPVFRIAEVINLIVEKERWIKEILSCEDEGIPEKALYKAQMETAGLRLLRALLEGKVNDNDAEK